MTAAGPTDIDQIAVELACHGDRTIHLTGPELDEALATLTARGVSGRETARILGINERRVWRWRAGMRPYSRKAAS